MTVSGRFRFEPLGKRHNREAFSCGVEALDRYFREQAGQDRDRLVAAVWVLHDADDERVVGFYTLSMNRVALESVPDDLRRKLTRYPDQPVALLGRLAVDKQSRGQGFGEKLLMDALRRAHASTAQVAAVAVIVDAKDDTARAFYEGYGFSRLLDNEFRLFLPMGTIARTFL